MTQSQRRAHRAGEQAEPRVERIGDVWRIRSLEVARQVLRARHATTQAGFTAEYIPKGVLKHHPILMSDGPLHDEQRSKVGRFFAPKVVKERHGDHIASAAERYVDPLVGEVALDEVALLYSVEVTSEIVGLTESPVGKRAERLVQFFRQPPLDVTRPDLGRSRGQWMQAAWRGVVPIARFYVRDVRPAIRRRRQEPMGDVISHLIAEGYTDTDILVECVTYGTAGMVTTREFITMAAWHLLSNPALKERYVVAGRTERHAILNEIIRLEPVVGHLYRRAQQEIVVTDGDLEFTIEPGHLLDVCVRQVNTDPRAVGEAPDALCPARDLPSGVDASVMTFGDGAHRCPGQPLAIFETDELLTRLLQRKPKIVQEPEITWDDLIEGYVLRGLMLDVPPLPLRTAADVDGAAVRSVRKDFDRGARRYDLMVSLNPGYHRELRRAADALFVRLDGNPQKLLDLACGSGASTQALLAAAPEGSYVLGVDASPGMLDQARKKTWPPQVQFVRGTVGELNLDRWERGSFDGAHACYLFRNVPTAQRDRAVEEVFALLRPGGWLCAQEYSVAGNRSAKRVWDAVSHAVIIPLGLVVDRNPGLYRYLWRSVVDFDSVSTFADRLSRAGFVDVAHRTATGWQRGILHTFIARKPEETS